MWWSFPDINVKTFYCSLIGVSVSLLVFVVKIKIGEETFLWIHCDIHHLGLMGGKTSLRLAK